MSTDVVAALSAAESALPAELAEGAFAEVVAGIPCVSYPLRQPWATQAKVMDVPSPHALAAATGWLADHAAAWTVTIRAAHAREPVFAGLTPRLELPCLVLSAGPEAGSVHAVDGLTIGRSHDRAEFLAVFGEEFAPLFAPQALAHKDSRYLVGRIDGQPVACAKVELAAGTAYIGGIAVLPSHRGRGIGVAISAAAVEAARQLDPSLIWLTAVRELHPLYTRLGFREADVHVQLSGGHPAPA
ncbi:GNAT family N-acetyltransferase [Flindersiella endophytica]